SEEHGIVNLRIPHDGARGPISQIGRIERVVDLPKRIAGDLVTPRIEEKRACGIASPGETDCVVDRPGQGVDAYIRLRVDDPRELQAGVEDVLVRRALGPEAAAAD